MKTIGMLCLMLSVFSCACTPKFKTKIRKAWSVKKNECRCQTYNINKIKVLSPLVRCEEYYQPLVDSEKYQEKCKKKKFRRQNKELCEILPNEEYCEALIGYSVKDWLIDLTPVMREMKAYAEDQCNQ